MPSKEGDRIIQMIDLEDRIEDLEESHAARQLSKT